MKIVQFMTKGLQCIRKNGIGNILEKVFKKLENNYRCCLTNTMNIDTVIELNTKYMLVP